MKKTLLALLLCIAGVTAFSQARSDEAEVRKIITDFESALQNKDLVKIEDLVSPQIVVFENGYRNDGWEDFRDHHLVPEFKHPSSQYTTALVKLDVSPSMAWGYSSMSRAYIHKSDKQPEVWTSYVLRKHENGKWKIVVLNWSVKRTSE